MAVHYARAKISIASVHNLYFACIFVDITEAFISMQRYLVVDDHASLESPVERFRQNGLLHMALAALQQQVGLAR